MFFIGLETDYGFDYNKTKEMARSLVERYNELNIPLGAYHIKAVIEDVAGQPIYDLYRILEPGIKYNAYYLE